MLFSGCNLATLPLLLLLPLPSTAAAVGNPQIEDVEVKEVRTGVGARGTEVGDGPPQNLSALALSSTELNVTWSPPQTLPPLYYEVRVQIPYINEISYTTFYVLNGLTPCTTYQVFVSSVYNTNEQETASTDGTTGSEVPPPPQSCTITDVTSTSMRVTWGLPDTLCPINNSSVKWTYDVLWSEEQGSDEVIVPGTVLSNKDLIPYTKYTYEISSATIAGYGDPIICSQTTENENGPPQNLSALALSSTELNVTWSPPQTLPPLYYLVRVQSPYINEISYTTFYVLNGLTPCTTYQVFVSSVYNTNELETASTDGTTGSEVPPPPQSCTITDVTSTSMRVTWGLPDTECPINNSSVKWTYDVLWSEEQGSDEVIVPGTVLSNKDLIPYTNYTYEISSATIAGYGDPIICSQTTENEIHLAMNVRTSIDSATITWQAPPPHLTNGITIQYYEITILTHGGANITQTVPASEFPEATVTGLVPCRLYTGYMRAGDGVAWGPAIANVKFSLPGDGCEKQEVQPPNHVSSSFHNSASPPSYPHFNDAPIVSYDDSPLASYDNSPLASYDDAPLAYYGTSLEDNTYGTNGEQMSSFIEEYYEEDVDSTSNTTPAFPDGPPQNLSALALSSTKLNVTWSPPHNLPLYYLVRVQSPYINEISYTTFYVLNGLTSCTTYQVFVSSVYNNIEQETASTDGTTGSEVPPPPQSCTITDVTSTSMRVTWGLPDTLCPINNSSVKWTYDVLWSEEQGSEEVIVPGIVYSNKDLIPYTNYTYKISAATSAGYGDPIICSKTTEEEIPGLVNITDVIVSDRSATIYWLPAYPTNGVTKRYEVTLYDSSSTIQKSFAGSLLQGTFDVDADGLHPCVSYTVNIRAVNGKGQGDLNPYDEPFIIYSDVPVDSVSCDVAKWTMTVCWVPNSASCPVSKYLLNWTYDILWSEETGSGSIEIPGDTNDFCEARDNLTPYTKYSVCVIVGETPGKCCSKLTDPAAPSAPYLKELAVEGVSINASWVEPEQKNGILNGYVLTWTDSKGDSDGNSFSNSTLSHTIQGLKRCEIYTITVKADTIGAGFSLNSNERIANITNSIPEGNLKCDGSQSTEAYVSWILAANDCSVSSYNISWTTNVLWNGEKDAGTSVISGDRTDFILQDLLPYTAFQFCITIEFSLEEAVCCDGTTDEEVPSEPESLQVMARTENSISVNWTMPTTVNGDLKDWMASCSTTNDVVVRNETVALEHNNFTCVQLNSGTSYNLMVQGRTGAGLGPPATVKASTITGKNENLGLILGLSIGGGLLLVVVVVVGGTYYYRRRYLPGNRSSTVASRSAGYKGEDNTGMEMNEHDSDGRDMYEEQQKSYRQQRYWTEKTHGKIDFGTTSEIHARARLSLRSLDVPTSNQGIREDRRRSSQMESEFTSFGILPRLSSAGTDDAPSKSRGDRRPSQQDDYKPRILEDFSRRYSVQPVGASRLDEMHRRPSLQPGAGEMNRRDNRDRRSSMQPRMTSIEEEERRRSQDHGGRRMEDFTRRPSVQPDQRRGSEFNRRPSLQPDQRRGSEFTRRPSVQPDQRRGSEYNRRPSLQPDHHSRAMEDRQRHKSMIPGYEMRRRPDDYDLRRRSDAPPRRHSVQPNIQMRRPEDFPGLYDSHAPPSSRSSGGGGVGARRQSLDARMSGRRSSEQIGVGGGPRTSVSGGPPSSRRPSAPLLDEVNGRRGSGQELRERDYRRPSRMWSPSGLPDIQDEYE
ncbi:hypothetical protein Pcinc_034857 [Petrolisthes cinctipes]|uniref:Fibronectin type-III domain-containing protein n=1 Tax=Petrolisthes cinctipes TaxID=88211 RepID=A0AAE1EPZ5_PETCI|nr:hypothetical protein Pcinc_034857 [Petrolisthes cinctipes]